MSPISLKCCLKAHVTYKSGEFPCLHLIAPLLRFWLQRSQLSRATCFIGVTPVWAQGTKKKRNSLKLLLLLFFKNKKMLKKKKTKNKKKTHKPGTLLQPVKPITLNRKPYNCQTDQSNNFVDAKEYSDSQAAQPETGNLSLWKIGSYLATKD